MMRAAALWPAAPTTLPAGWHPAEQEYRPCAWQSRGHQAARLPGWLRGSTRRRPGWAWAGAELLDERQRTGALAAGARTSSGVA
jgi:hypothetical protein